MSDYTKSTNFASKDSLSSGNPLKIVKGTEIDTEFNNIATAMATKANSLSPTLSGTPTAPTATAGTNTTQIATTAFVTTAAANAVTTANVLDTTRIDVASASTVDLTTNAPNTRHINITGTTTINEFTVAAGKTYFVRFNAALTLTNGASLVTQLGRNIVTVAGDTCIIRSTAANAVEILDYSPVTPDKQIESITATVATNALTVTLNPTRLDFRSSTLGSGTVNTRYIQSAISLTVPSGATLGTASGIPDTLTVIALDNAGTVELAIVNTSSDYLLNETTLISTTLLDSSSDSADVVYSAAARTGVPYRIVGYVTSTQITAGTWATSPSNISGAGLTFKNSTLFNGTTQVASGTAVDFTSIPSWVKRIVVMFNGVSTNGSNNLLVQMGSGSFETTGYVSGATQINSGSAVIASATTGMLATGSTSASSVIHGSLTLSLITGNTWSASATVWNTAAVNNVGAGTKTLSGTLDRVRITSVGSTDTFDAGSINIMYE